MSDFIRVNFIETDDKYGCFQIYHKSNLAIICLDNAEKVYYATSFEREGKGIRRISECEYDRLCKELGIEDVGDLNPQDTDVNYRKNK